MPDKIPRLTNHAVERASERLGLDEQSLTQWVAATHQSWIPVNATYLHNHNIKCTALRSTHYVTPWVFGVGVAIVVSDDNVIKTIIDYRIDIKQTAIADALMPKLAAAIRLLSENPWLASGIIVKALGKEVTVNIDDAYASYAAKLIDTNDLQTIASAAADRRPALLESLLESNNVKR